MTATENRIVKMVFDNLQFKKAASETMSQLTALDRQVTNAGDGKGLLNMGKAMDTVKVKASAMQVAAIAAIANIANRAVDAGVRMAKSLTIDPIKQGFDEYELKMKSIQTILANTDGESLKSVTKTLNELNTYADKTIYNFANMTDAIGKMTTAGIDMKVATKTVQGFHNMVALSGGDATAAAGALEQFNQGLQAGVIKLVDWKSLQTRGLGSKALQESFFETARAMGTIKDLPVDATFESWTKAQGGFNATLESGWLTADVATKSYSIMAGEYKTVDELMKQGFSRKAAEDMLETAKNAEESATKVRTFSGFIDTLKESVGSGWSQVFELVIGDFNEATNLFTNLSDKAGSIVGGFFDGLTKIIKGFDKLGGKTTLLRALSNIAAPAVAIFGKLGDAIEKVFGGGKPGAGATKFANALEHATRPLRVLAKLIDGTISPSEALVRVWEILTNGIRNVVNEIGGAGSIVDSFANKAEDLAGMFSGGFSMKAPKMPELPSLPSVSGIFGDSSAVPSGLSSGIDKIAGSVKNLNKETKDGPMFNPDADISAGRVTDAADSITESLSGTESEAKTLGDILGPILGGLLDMVVGFLKGFAPTDIMEALKLGVLTAFVVQLSKVLITMRKSFEGFVGFGESLNGILGGAGAALQSFQTAARAQLIMAIAIAVGVLAVSLWLLSRIPIDKLATGLLGMAGVMLIMKVGMDSMVKAAENMSGRGTAVKLTALSVAMLALAGSMLLLAAAFLLFEKVDIGGMIKGIVALMAVMIVMQKLGDLGKYAARTLLASSVGLLALATSLLILAGALLLFKLVDWESMGKAGVAIAGLTGVLMLLSLVPAAGLAKAGAAMLVASVGMLALSAALIAFGLVQWESLGKAGVALGGLTVALGLMSIVANPASVSAMLGISVALLAIATAGVIFNSVDWSSIGKLALVLGILTLGFAGFLGVIMLFAPAMLLLTGFSLAIALLAASLAVLAGAMTVMFGLMTAGTLAFASFAISAATAFTAFMQTLAIQAPLIKDAFIKILAALIDGVVEAVPMLIDGVKRLWNAVKAEFTGGGGGNKQAFMGQQGKSWIEKLGDGIKKMIPAIVDKAIELMKKFADGLIRNAGTLASKGVQLVVALIDGISSKIGLAVEAATNLIIKFMEGIGAGAAKLAQAGIRLIAKFLHDLASAIRSGAAAIGGGISDVVDAMRDVGVDMVKGLIAGVGEMMGDALNAIGDLASNMVGKAKSILKIFSPSRVFRDIGKFLVTGLTKGIQDNAVSAITATAAMVSGSIAVASQYMSKFVQDLDQQAIAATARADGLAAAAERAARMAEKSKNKKDDRAAEKLQRKADRAATRAEKRSARAEEARTAAERAEQFEDASLIERAEMRAEDAQNQLDAAKEAEFNAASKLQQAAALREQAKKKGVSKKDAKEMREAADRLEKQAQAEAKKANALISAARTSATNAMALQKAAADAAAADFQARYEAEAREDAEEDAFNKMTDEEKAAERRRQAAILQQKADADLARAKELAYTDLEAANELAEQALDQADKARQYVRDAEQYEQTAAQARDSQSVDTGGNIVNLDPTEAASIAFNDYAEQYNSGLAASAGDNVVEFNQYNTSPEYLSEADIYRRTNNQLEFAGARLGVPA